MARRTGGRPSGRVLHTEGFEAIALARNLLKRSIADAAEVSPQFLADLLAHRAGASTPVVERLAAALGVTPAALFPELVGWVSPLPDRDARRRGERS
jgi:hypothetical protein